MAREPQRISCERQGPTATDQGPPRSASNPDCLRRSAERLPNEWPVLGASLKPCWTYIGNWRQLLQHASRVVCSRGSFPMFRYPSPSLVISLFALLVALGGAGIAATGGNFILGQSNSASSLT